MVTSSREWKAKKAAELKLPSGNVALVRNPGIHHFLHIGIIPDPMMAMVQKMISGKQKDFDPADFIKDEESLLTTFELFDKVLVEVVVEPKVVMPPKKAEDRDDETLYADDVDFEDKVFIFQFAVGGTRDLEEYLQRQKQAMDTVQPSEGVDGPAK